MKRKLMLVFLWSFILVLGAALPAELSRSTNPELYKQLMPRAKANLKNLPRKEGKQYQKLLKANDDILMAYLIAYESDANLAESKPEYILSNYQQIKKLLEKEGLKYDAKFFLSYIAKQSVSDERITPYRAAMLKDGLQRVIDEYDDPLQRYRATASWCVEKLQFMQTSGRDQSPLDITEKSLVGRCEEMQILFVAAARTVGLPSRPASTPWWAHIDNNHAWAEVYLDGVWAYTGDMDAAYHPNQTWFSGLIDKTVLILADGSMATDSDEVLAEGKYEVSINSTRNYAKERTRRVHLSVADEEGEPLANCFINILVYNWGMLRPLSSFLTDAEGKVSFSAGRGAFYISAFKGGKRALHLVESDASQEIYISLKLSKNDDYAQDAILHYPANEMIWLDAPQSYNEDIRHRKELWQSQIDEWQLQASQSAAADSLILELLSAAKGNYAQILKYIQRRGAVNEDFVRFLLSYDPKFLWQTDYRLLEALERHYRRYQFDEDYPPQVYYPSVFYEELPRPVKEKGKWQLYPNKLIRPGDTELDKLNNVMAYLTKKHKIKAKKAMNGLLRFDLALGTKYLNNYQFRILAIAALRANGIAAEYTRVPDMILVYINGDWQYYDAIRRRFESGEAAPETKKLEILVRDEEGFALAISAEQLMLSRYLDGVFYALNHRFEETSTGHYQSLIPDQDICLQFGYRISDSDTAVQVLPLENWDGESAIEISARRYPKAWQEADEAFLTLFDAEVLEAKDSILLGNYDSENSLRILERIKARDYIFYGYEESPGQLPNYEYLAAWEQLVSKNRALALRSHTFIKKEGRWLQYEGFWEKLP